MFEANEELQGKASETAQLRGVELDRSATPSIFAKRLSISFSFIF